MLLFQVPGMLSMSYQVVYLQVLGPAHLPAAPVDAQGVVTLSNGTVELTLSQGDGWAITQLTVGSDTYVQQDGTCGNRIGIWNDTGNIYQFGMEFTTDCCPATFDFASFPAGAGGQFVEQGPVRWRFAGQLEGGFSTQYDLIRGETLVRMTTSGTASVDTSVLVSFPMQTASGATGDVLEYGTSYYWENRNPQQSWSGLTFRACRNFAQLATSAGDAVAAVYHNGIPAWTIDGSILRGCLLRNTPNGPRGATGHDNGLHVQSYTLDVEGQLAVTGYPLRTALYAQTPLAAIVVADDTRAVLPAFAQLASVAQSDAVLRVGKTNERGLILRVQQPRTALDPQRLDINLPFLSGDGTAPTPEIVTALETAPARQTPVTLVGQTASFEADRAVWTMRVPLETTD
ncbi:MAG TPA: hypothetical protein VJ276_22000 [Thermoanaerobaculia bacterium]|nr:hypothetical protein [Thermoanaerobaculia bacterium]